VGKVFVVDVDRTPLRPVSPCQAKKLLRAGRAAVLRRYPFTLVLKREVEKVRAEPLRLKIDPGSKVTGLAVVNDRTGEVVFAAEIRHRGDRIRAALNDRRTLRRWRRRRKTRYRKPRFANRRRPEGWLAPSLKSRVANIETWVGRIYRLAPIGALSMELVKFDLQAMERPEIHGAAYQQGELAGRSAREYLLEQWHHACAYCGARGVPLQKDHIRPRHAAGTNRLSNLTLACSQCNMEKGSRPVEEFLGEKPDLLARIQAQARVPLRDAAAVNMIRWELFWRLKGKRLPLETATGARTKLNRTRLGLSKEHWIDAACVGTSTPEKLRVDGVQPLRLTAMGHGRRQACITDEFGFPTAHRPRHRERCGFRTGDIVRAVIPSGKYAGTHVGRVTVRSRGSFRLFRFDVHSRHLVRLQRTDGYNYGKEEAAPLPRTQVRGPRAAEM
jgi:5-methylcytosine-specific restriction endonuclease McrA